MSQKKIFIYSIPRKTATGISDWTNDSSGRTLKKVKIGRCKDGIQALYSPKVGGLANHISYTPWTDENGQQKHDDKGRQLTLQDKMEQKWGKEKGFFTNSPRRSEDIKANIPPTYFQQKRWRLNDGSTVFDLNNMDDEMGYYVCLDSKYVANSERQWRSNKWPYATHYIALENESDEIKYQKAERKSKAFAALHDPKMTNPTKKKFVHILQLASSLSHLTDQQVHNLLFDYIDSTDYTPNSNLSKFEKLVDLMRTKTGREELNARHTLKRAQDARIVYEKQGTYTWIRPEGKIIIGDRYEEAVDFFLNPSKQDLVEDMEKQIKAKTD